MAPFKDEKTAEYWGGGVLAEAVGGGYYSLHARSIPGGVNLYSVGLDADDHPECVAGWPTDALVRRYAWATPDNGGETCICEVSV